MEVGLQVRIGLLQPMLTAGCGAGRKPSCQICPARTYQCPGDIWGINTSALLKHSEATGLLVRIACMLEGWVWGWCYYQRVITEETWITSFCWPVGLGV